MTYGFTDSSFSMNGSMSTTRSFRIAKFSRGSIKTGRFLRSFRYRAQVRLGVPSTFAPHDPQIPIRQDHR